jgi:hypothetical protein
MVEMNAVAENVFSSSLAWLRSMRPVLSLLALAGFCSCCFGQLPADLDLPSETVDSGTLVLQASNSITNSASLLVQNPASVTLSAGSYIRLEPGFNATSGSTFHAVINPNVVNWQPITVPAPPTACADCGLNFVNSISGTSAQDMYAPSTSYSSVNMNKYAYCTELNPPYRLIPCNISLSISAVPNSNGHYHSIPPPPVSSIIPAYGYTGNYPNYAMPFTLTTTQVGQVENIIVSDLDQGGQTTYHVHSVGYRGLVSVDNSNILYQTGGNTTSHGDNTFNHHMTVNAATGLQAAATDYINHNNPGQKACINDMALPIGGKFDICWSAANNCRDSNHNLIVNPWGSPHASHDQGTSADVAVSSPQCPANYLVNAGRFILACVAHGASAKRSINEGNHVHCHWPN